MGDEAKVQTGGANPLRLGSDNEKSSVRQGTPTLPDVWNENHLAFFLYTLSPTPSSPPKWPIASGQQSLCSNAFRNPTLEPFRPFRCSQPGPSRLPLLLARKPRLNRRANPSTKRPTQRLYRVLDWNDDYYDRVFRPLDLADVARLCKAHQMSPSTNCPTNVSRRHGRSCLRTGRRS